MTISEVVAVSLISSVVAIVTTLINAFFNRKKLSAEASSILTSAASGLVEKLFQQIEELEQDQLNFKRKVVHQRRYIRELTAYVELLVSILREHQVSGIPAPPQFDDLEE